MSAINGALQQLGVDLAVDAGANLIGAISDFADQNLSPEMLAAANAGLQTLSQSGNGSLVPGIAKYGVAGEWESVHYADDLNAHHPKFKFLFKVQFEGFPGGNFSYFIHRCDKPKVRFNHTDVNYYNFRTKVLTSTQYDPLSFTFLDEIGNTVNSFFASYVSQRSRQGDGRASIKGGDAFSSTVPYKNGYSAGRSVKIQQIFANGLATNIFTLVNARIDAFDFDELNMEQSAGSMLTCTVSYDAITCETTGSSTINSWGNTDLLRGGGTSGPMNAGASSIGENPAYPSSAYGGIGGDSPFITQSSQESYDGDYDAFESGFPQSLSGLLPEVFSPRFNQGTVVGSNTDILSSNVQGTLNSITSGSNLITGGTGIGVLSDMEAANNNPNYSNEGRGAPLAGSNAAAAANNPNYSNEARIPLNTGGATGSW